MGEIPIAGWFISWKIPSKIAKIHDLGVPLFQETPFDVSWRSQTCHRRLACNKDLGEANSNIDTRKYCDLHGKLLPKVGLSLSEMCTFYTCHFQRDPSFGQYQRASTITKASYGWCGRQTLRRKAIHADDGACKAAIIIIPQKLVPARDGKWIDPLPSQSFVSEGKALTFFWPAGEATFARTCLAIETLMTHGYGSNLWHPGQSPWLV